MDKKTILLVSIIVFLLIVIGFLSYIEFFNHNQAKIGGVTFEIPSGYYLGTDNKLGDATITNGSDMFYIAEYNGTNVSKYVNGYVGECKKNGLSPSIINFTVNKLIVYKSVIPNNDANHYWFTYDNKVFSIYTWKENPNIDLIVFEIAKSIKSIS